MNNNISDLTNHNLMGEEFDGFTNPLKGKLKGLVKKTKAKVKKTKADAKARVLKAKGKIKKVTKKLKDKVGAVGKKFRNRFRAIMRKGILLNLKKNIHGLATQLYPAIATPSELKSRKIKPAFATKSKGIYAKLVARWTSLGGSEADLKSAIEAGSKKRFLKAPYKSIGGNNSLDFYSYFTPNVSIYSGDDGTETTEEEGVINEDEGTEEVPDQEEQVKGQRGFFAWLKSLFSKESPYEDGTADASTFNTDSTADAGNVPPASEANNDVMKTMDTTATTDDAGGETDEDAGDEAGVVDDTILGMNKYVFYGGVALLGVVALFVAYKLITRKK